MMREMVDSSQGRSEVLAAAFFARAADRVARDLIGARLAVRRPDGVVERHLVFETEAYLGAHDLACHGARGRTARNAVMFGPAGRWYVYLCYGLHWMLNIVTGPEGVPAASSQSPPDRVAGRPSNVRSTPSARVNRPGPSWLPTPRRSTAAGTPSGPVTMLSIQWSP